MVLCSLCGGQHVWVLTPALRRPVKSCCALHRVWWALPKAPCTTSAGESQLVSSWSVDTLMW